MKFFNSGLFWFIEGVLATVVIMGFKTWMGDRGVKMNWWKWGFLGLWMLMAGFTIAFVGTSIGENEPVAAFRGGVVFGIVTVVSGMGLWRMLNRGRENE